MLDFADSGIQLELRIWISDPENGIGNVRTEVNPAIWRLFKTAGITIPIRSGPSPRVRTGAAHGGRGRHCRGGGSRLSRACRALRRVASEYWIIQCFTRADGRPAARRTRPASSPSCIGCDRDPGHHSFSPACNRIRPMQSESFIPGKDASLESSIATMQRN